MSQVIARGLQELVTFELVDYRDFAKQHPGEFDRIISCEMVRPSHWWKVDEMARLDIFLRQCSPYLYLLQEEVFRICAPRYSFCQWTSYPRDESLAFVVSVIWFNIGFIGNIGLCAGAVADLSPVERGSPELAPYFAFSSWPQIEAVGHNYLGTFFAASDALLAPCGIMVMQAITTPENRYHEYITSTDFINTIIFPGSNHLRRVPTITYTLA